MNLQTLDWSTILIDVGMLAFLVLAVVVVVRLLAKPIKALLKFLVHAATGILVFYAVNYVGGRFFGFTMEPTNLRLVIGGLGGGPRNIFPRRRPEFGSRHGQGPSPMP